MQGINNQNAGRGGMYHYSNRRTQNNRFSTQNKDWRLSQMLNEWELQQEAKKKEEMLKEKVKERKELTKNLIKIMHSKSGKKKKRNSTSSESSTSKDELSTPEESPETTPEHRKKKRKHTKRRKELNSNSMELEDINKSLIDLRTTNEKIHKEMLDLKKTQAGTIATVERIEYEVNILINEKDKLESRIKKLEPKSPAIFKGKEKKIKKMKEHVNLESESEKETELKDKGSNNDDLFFDIALNFGIATCVKKSDLEKKFEKREGTAKLKEFCEKVNIRYITKNKAMDDVWQMLLDNNITK